MFTRRVVAAVVSRVARFVRAYREALPSDQRRRRDQWPLVDPLFLDPRLLDGAGLDAPQDVCATERMLGEAVEDVIHRLDFATVAELRSAAHVLHVVLRSAGRAEGRRILEGLVDLMVAEANHHEATIDRELASMLRAFGDGR